MRGEKGCTVPTSTSPSLQHTWIGDLNVNVSSPAVTGVTLANQICNTGPVAGFSAIMDSDAAGAIGSVCPPTPLARVKPGGAGVDPAGLDQFDRKDPNGQWSLNINDLVNGDGGTVNGWSVDDHVPVAGAGAARGAGGASPR
ncbi:MAG: proprotein convertase P-domain-containing protein [Anaerolineae bacterium]